jgi:hypothetical protein
MRIRDILQMIKTLGRNLANSVKLKLKPDGTPEIEISGEGLLDLHARSILLSKLVADGFNKRRIFWEDTGHELSFVEPRQRTGVCTAAVKNASAAIDTAISEISGGSGAELKLVDILLAISTKLRQADGEFLNVPDLEKYNAWVLNIGGDASEKMTAEEHLQKYIEVIRSLRQNTYPLWESIIDLLPDGEVSKEAVQCLKNGRKSVELDSAETEPKWIVIGG